MNRGWAVSISAFNRFADPNTGCETQWALNSYGPDREEYVERLGSYRGDTVHAMLRAWGFQKIMPERALAGVIKHLQAHYAADLAEKQITAEDYAGRCAAVAAKMAATLPPPPWGDGVATERKASISIDGVPWTVKPDFESLTHLRDFKVVWAKSEIKSEVDLISDVQALIYTHARQARTGEKQTDCVWHYGVPGKSAFATVREFSIDAQHVREQVARINETGRRIHRLTIEQPDPMTLKKNPAACGEFGGCPHRRKCWPNGSYPVSIDDDTGKTPAIAKHEGMKMGLLDKLKAQSTGTPETKAPEAKTETKAPAKDADAPKGNDAAEALAKAKRMIGMGIEVHEIVNGLKSMYPTFSHDQLGEIVALARSVTPKVEEKKEPEKAPAKEESVYAGPEPTKRGRVAKDNAPALTPPDYDVARTALFKMQAKLADEITTSADGLRERVAMAALLLGSSK